MNWFSRFTDPELEAMLGETEQELALQMFGNDDAALMDARETLAMLQQELQRRRCAHLVS